MKRLVSYPDDAIMCMSNIRGRKVKNPGQLPFSFYFSNKNSNHEIRVKPVFNPDKMLFSKTGNLELYGDWNYTPGPDDKRISNKDITSMKSFFRRYIVLFCAVWDEQLTDSDLADYFEGDINFHELLTLFDFYDDYSEELDSIKDVVELEQFCRNNNLVNLRDN